MVHLQEVPVIAERRIQSHHQVFLVRELAAVFPNQKARTN
jgi:hypothetical protein